MNEYEAGIIRTENRGNNTYLLDCACEPIAREVVPGQFVQIRVGEGTDPFLRRTFSVCGALPAEGIIRLMIEVKALGTGMLCTLKRGETMNIIGPLGKGFDTSPGKAGMCLLVAGGVGAAPLLFLAKTLVSENRQVVFMMGARNAAGIRMLDGLVPGGAEFLTATEDGSIGREGMLDTLLEDYIVTKQWAITYTCGPSAMMRAVSQAARRADIHCQVSFEERMACGLGACYGCAVRLRGGAMARTCVDGPVFDADEVFS